MILQRMAPAGILLLGVVLTSGMREQYVMKPRFPMASMPTTIAGEPGRDIVVPEDERKIAGMSDYSLRAFGADSANVAFTTYVGYYDRQVQGKSIHSPRNCLPGGGWQIMETARVPVGGRSGDMGNRVLLANGSGRALVYYWYQGRGRIEPSEYRVKWDLLRDAALYGRTEEALVRIVIPLAVAAENAMPSAAERARADSLAATVAAALVPAVERAMPTSPR